MQIARLFEIVYLLMDKKMLTASALAQHFEVSTRTILRDVDTLSAAGIPIYTTQGKGGGIALLENFVLNKATINDKEQDEILFALQSLSAAQQADSSELLQKFRALFSKTETSWIEVDFSRWGNSEADKEKFDILKNAILQKQTISFFYPAQNGKTKKRKVQAIKLIFKSRYWYLQGFCLLKNGYRTFKINRIIKPKLTGEYFTGTEFSPPDIGMPTSEISLAHIELIFAPEMAFRVYDEFDEKDIQVQKNGSCRVDVDLPMDEWLPGYLLTFGAGVRVQKPRQLREIMLQRIDDIRKHYQK